MRAHVCFVRHGQTVANREKIRQGISADYPLTEQGHDEAHRAGVALKDENWDYIFTSDLPRAVTVRNQRFCAVCGLILPPAIDLSIHCKERRNGSGGVRREPIVTRNKFWN